MCHKDCSSSLCPFDICRHCKELGEAVTLSLELTQDEGRYITFANSTQCIANQKDYGCHVCNKTNCYSASRSCTGLEALWHEQGDAHLAVCNGATIHELLGYNLDNSPDSMLPARGLNNLGNTCYLNALLNSLSAVPLVVAWATQHKESERCRDYCHPHCPLCCLAADFNTIFSSGLPFNPRLAVHRAHWSNNRFFNFDQQDVHEAFATLFVACNAIDESFSERLVHVQSRQYNSNVLLTTPGNVIFGGLQSSILHCQNCRRYSRKLEPFTNLNLPLSSDNLSGLFHNYLQWELCEGHTRCCNCNTAGYMQKCIDIKLENLPRVLFITLKRFTYDPSTQSMCKITDRVHFPLLWDANVGAEYHLKAVIVHKGKANNQGHYIAYCCTSIGAWYVFDDHNDPCLVDVNTVLTSQAYCLLYCLK